jgi:hypothetical protein
MNKSHWADKWKDKCLVTECAMDVDGKSLDTITNYALRDDHTREVVRVTRRDHEGVQFVLNSLRYIVGGRLTRWSFGITMQDEVIAVCKASGMNREATR